MKKVEAPKLREISADLAEAVAAVTAQAIFPGTTAAPFITSMQREAVAREMKRLARVRFAKLAGGIVAGLVLLHVTVTQFFNQAPSAQALIAHVQRLPESVIPFYSSLGQPLQADGVIITQADKMSRGKLRYVASVTLRLRQPLYVAAVTNGTAQYRRLQTSLQIAREQEMRFNLFSASEAPEVPALPVLLQRAHQTGETIVVRVPFTARRFGWQWRLAPPQIALRMANRVLEGDSLERYAETPHLIFGGPKTLVDVRQRVKLANDYVIAVAKEVQKQSEVVAVRDTPVVDPSIADQPALPAEVDLANVVATVDAFPAFDPHAVAVTLPAAVRMLEAAPPVARR